MTSDAAQPVDSRPSADDNWDLPLSEVQFSEGPVYTGHIQRRRSATPAQKRLREFAGVNQPKKFAKSREQQRYENRHGF